MTVKCINCSHWRPRQTRPELYKLGMAICNKHSISAGHTYGATYDRDCAEFNQAAPAVIEKRVRFDEKV